MKITTLAALITATLIGTVVAPASSAQQVNGAADGIEVITITAKRQAPTVASVCVNEVLARNASTARSGQGSYDTLATSDASRAERSQVRQAIRQCIEKASAQI